MWDLLRGDVEEIHIEMEILEINYSSSEMIIKRELDEADSGD